MAQTTPRSLEEAARVARYGFLARVAQMEGAPVIVTGHHAGDQAETVLMHLLRGSGLAGLRGMQPAARLPGQPDLWLWRPFLGVDRAAIEAYCAAHDLRPLHDASNADPVFFRNRLRHELLPALEAYSPQIRQRLVDLAEIVAADEALLDETSGRAWNEVFLESDATHVALGLDEWRALPLGLRRRTLRRAIATLRPDLRDVGFSALEAARAVTENGATGAQATLPGGLALTVSYGKLVLANAEYDPATELAQLLTPAPQPLPVPGEVELAGGWRITAERVVIDFAAVAGNRDPWTAHLAPDVGQLTVRGRQAGERIRPLGLNGETTLKEVMIDRKIPAAARALWPVVATVEYPVWLVGHLLDERARVPANGADAVRLRCLPPSNL